MTNTSKRSFKEKNQYGVPVQSKGHKACLMYEAGADPRDVEDKLGYVHWNMLMRLERAGHQIMREYGVGGNRGRKRTTKITLIPRDAVLRLDGELAL